MRGGFVALGFVLAAAAWMFAFQLSLTRPSARTEWVAALYREKAALASAHPGARIIIGGGSSALFGLRADILALATGRPVVNYSTHAALGMENLLYRLRAVLRPGDTVLLCLEYELYGRERRRTQPAALDDLDASLEALAPYLYWKAALQTPWERVLIPWRKPPLTPETWFNLYVAPHLDAYGDSLGGNEVLKSIGTNARLDALDPSAFIVTHDNAALVASFVEWCRQRQIVVWATAPSLLSKPQYANDAYVKRFRQVESLFRDLGVPYWVPPQHALYPARDMFDTEYHLVLSAGERNTRKVLDAMGVKGPCPRDREAPACESPLCELASSFRGWTPEGGIGPFEGPYPQWQLGPVVWMLGDEMVVRAAEPSSPQRISARFRASRAGQEIEFWADDQMLKRIVATSDTSFVSTAMETAKPVRSVKIRTRGGKADAQRRSVLFGSLELTSAEVCQ